MRETLTVSERRACRVLGQVRRTQRYTPTFSHGLRGSPWENGYIESFNGKLRDELLNGEIFTTLQEARVLTKWWRWQYIHIRPHSSLGYRPPVPEAVTKPLTVAAS